MADKFERKFQEQYLALQLEKVVDKDWILENYLNAINLGQNTLGVGVASERYFGKRCLGSDAFRMCRARGDYPEPELLQPDHTPGSQQGAPSEGLEQHA